MIKKLIWMVVLVLMTACTILFSDGVDFPPLELTGTPTVCVDCTPQSTETPLETSTVEPTVEFTATSETEPTAEITETVISTTQAPTATNTPIPTATFTATATSTAVPPTPTKTSIPASTLTVTPAAIIYSLQPATPMFLSNFVHPDEGCAWQGVAGQVFDKNGNPVTNLIIKVTGMLNGVQINQIGITGMVSGLPYGPGSFEIVLGAEAVNSIDQLKIQVFNANAQALTNLIPFSTSSDCKKNLVLINFKQN